MMPPDSVRPRPEVALIACSNRKSPGGTAAYAASAALSHALDPRTLRQLMDARRELATVLGLQPGHDLGFDSHTAHLLFKPSFLRYDGTVYRESHLAGNLRKAGEVRLPIISALYGLLDAEDPIREYNQTMSFCLPSGVRISTWWKKKGLGTIVAEYISAIGPAVVHDLLPQGYRAALLPWPPHLGETEIRIYDYPGLGQGSNYHRGRQLAVFFPGVDR